MTRNGKIARLPREIREQLNRRLQDGEPGVRLVEWLNSNEQVRHVLIQDFDGRAISEQNLSEWKQGGYRDWEAGDAVRHLVEQSNQFGELTGATELSQRLTAVLTAELAKQSQELLAETSDPAERWRQLQEAIGKLIQLRRAESVAGRLLLEREHCRKAEAEAKAKEEAAKNLFPLNAAILQYGFHQLVSGASPTGQAVMIQTLERLAKKGEAQSVQAPERPNPNQANSRNAPRPNPTNSK